MFDEFRIIVLVELSKSPKSFESLEESISSKQSIIESYSIDRVNRFNSNNINYFDLFYESKSINIISIIEYIRKSIFFRDIYIFLNRVKNIARVKSDILLH